jgi:hypothetical protein
MRIEDLGVLVHDIWYEEAEWSQRVFGSDQKRGPIGPLKHLEKEAKEAQASPQDIKEYADCLLLVFDAARRAGFKPGQLLQAAQVKLGQNKCRQWPTPVDDEPVEHVRESD